MMLVLFLFMASCGSDSNSNKNDPNSPTGQNPTPNQGDTDFNGTWNMWEKRGYLCGRVPAEETVRYSITIEQTGSQARLYINDDKNQSLSCETEDDELVCQGTYNSGDGWSIIYHEYRIGYTGTGNHTELIGSSDWTLSDNQGDCDGLSEGITSVDPGDTGGDGDGGGSGATGEDTYTNGCTNGSDDDGDGDVDCDDTDCAGDPACTGGDDDGLVCTPEDVCTPVCPTGNCSACATSGTCDSVCAGGGNCDYQCGGNGTQCNFECGGGNCDMSCQDSADCNMACPGGNCRMTCEGDADCNMACPGGNCDFTCATTGTCNTTCIGGNCTGS